MRFPGSNKFRDNKKQDNKKPSTGQYTASTISPTSKKSTFQKRQTPGERKQSLAKVTCFICKKSGHMANVCPDKKDKTEPTKSKDVKKVESGEKKKVNRCKWGSGLLKSRLCFLTSKNHKQDYKQRGTTTWG